MLHVLRNTVLWVIALSILNTSVDISENPFTSFTITGHTDETYDEIESIAEFVMDETFDQTLPDQNGNDEQGLLKKTVTFDFSIPEKKEKTLNLHLLTQSVRLSGAHDQEDLPDGFTTILTPPPDQA